MQTLRRGKPVRIRYDNNVLQTSRYFLGNSVYLPSGFAPSRRIRMDDSLIDVRILETSRQFSRLRILGALLVGRLEQSPLHHELPVPEFAFEALDGSTPHHTRQRSGPRKRPCGPSSRSARPLAPPARSPTSTTLPVTRTGSSMTSSIRDQSNQPAWPTIRTRRTRDR